jgi:hypothetical protein
VTNLHQVVDAPLHHIAMPDSMSSSPLVVALDPRVDEQVVQDQMQTAAEPEPDVAEPHTATQPEPQNASEESPERVVASGEGVVRPVAVVDGDVSTEPQAAKPDAAHDTAREAPRDVGVDRPL